MKNISITLNPYITGYSPVPPAPPQMLPGQTIPLNKNYQLTVGLQFDNEDEALEFTRFIISRINEFKDRNNEILGEAYFTEKEKGA